MCDLKKYKIISFLNGECIEVSMLFGNWWIVDLLKLIIFLLINRFVVLIEFRWILIILELEVLKCWDMNVVYIFVFIKFFIICKKKRKKKGIS